MPGSVPAWWNTRVPGTWAPVATFTTRTLVRSMPTGLRASFTRMVIVLPSAHASTPGGDGFAVAGDVLTTNGGPETASAYGAGQWTGSGQPHVTRHAVAPLLSGWPSTTTGLGEALP